MGFFASVPILAVFAGAAALRAAVPVPGEIVFSSAYPGDARGTIDGVRATLTDGTIACSWALRHGAPVPESLTDATGRVYDLKGAPLFALRVSEGKGAAKALVASDFKLLGAPRLENIVALPSSPRLAERHAGKRFIADFRSETGVEVRWSAELRDGAHYVRQTLRVAGTAGVLTEATLFDLPVTGARREGGATAGNPVVTDRLFFGMETPSARDTVSAGRFSIAAAASLPLEKGRVYDFASVIGTYATKTPRRAFLAYLERERPAPYRPFLHYNGWFDFDRNVTETGMLDTIAAYDRELVKKRGVPLKAFVIDDGWDDWNKGFWATDSRKFPDGFRRVGAAARKAGAGFGIWISPLGGYGESGAARIRQGARAGMIRDGKGGLDLSYEPYRRWFLDKTSRLVREDRATYFKFDKAGDGVNPHFMALIGICRELRAIDPGLVVNITVGTWPSPFWLNHIDCTWRDGNDMGWEGPGDDREQWITYRDAQTWRGVVRKGPLYPLNAIMTHGIVLSDGHFFAKRALKAGKDMKHEARSFFGSGTAMQELYVKPSVADAKAWDAIAEAAKWSRANADILADTHWVGGDPSNGGAVYGWAAWAPRKAVLTLRNPSDKPASFALDVGEAFEIPSGFPTRFKISGAYADTPSPLAVAEVGKPATLELKPFEVLVLEFAPAR